MLAIKNAKIYTMVGDVIENGVILIEDGKFAEIGANVAIPDGVEVIDAGGHMVTPGLVDAHTHIGLDEEGIGYEGADFNEGTNPVTPEMRGIDGVYPCDKGFLQARQGGITTVVTGPGSANCIGGTFLALKTYGDRVDNMVVKNPVAMKIAFGENPKRFYGKNGKMPMTRMGIIALMRDTLYKARDYMNKKEAGEKVDYNMQYEALIPVLKGKLQVKAHAHRSDDIFSAIRLAKEFNLDLSLEHCTEGHLIADELAKEGYPAICGPNLSGASKYELKNRSFETPAALYKAGMTIAIMTDNSVIPTAQLPICAGLAVKSGLPEMEALKAITINAAKITQIDDRVGSIEKGKDADLVVWTQNPVRDIECEAIYTIINGEIVYNREIDQKFGF